MTDWVRLWHDMPTDPKWRVIARKSGRSVSEVIAAFTFMMVNASANATERGRTNNLHAEDVAAALDLEEEDVSAIFAAMEGKVCADGLLLGWEKRQPKREDNSAERAKKWRESKKAEGARTQPNATERPETDTETDITVDKSTEPAAPAPTDPEKEFWSLAIGYLGANKRSVVGRWVRDHGRTETAKAITAAQVERAIDPVPYIERVLRGAKAGAKGPRVPV